MRILGPTILKIKPHQKNQVLSLITHTTKANPARKNSTKTKRIQKMGKKKQSNAKSCHKMETKSYRQMAKMANRRTAK